MPSDAFLVRDPAAAKFLSDPARRRYLEPFLGMERSVPEVARGLHEHPNSVLYRVRQLQAVGLLHFVREVPRRGRPEKRYRAVADRFYLPFDATTHADVTHALTVDGTFVNTVLQRDIERWLHTHVGPGEWMLEFSGEGGRAHMRRVRTDGQPIGTLSAPDADFLDVFALGFPMSPADAALFREDLRALLTRYLRPASDSATSYSLRMLLVPHETP
ncbi:helix-turn-helix domain-containing protein [Deinococcus sonorensis]|uniref:Helix-turn-helix domain-containing protein n=2 Tax=Deinococcus sonorensis TaxID=309891 RepID=A0AAU7U5J7_9DEIO